MGATDASPSLDKAPRLARKVKVAVVGIGFLGERHARVYSELPDVELVGVADTHCDRAKEIATKFGCEPFFDLADLAGKVDAVSVVVPTVNHYEVSRVFLGRGIATLLEKPMAASLTEADALIALAKEKDCLLQIGHIERFNAGIRKLRPHLNEARFIECHRMGPFAGRGIDVDVILDLMIHDIDMVLSLVPSPIVEVRAVGVPVLSSQIDIANVRLAFANGCVANLTASRVSSEKMRKIRIFQGDAYLSLDYLLQELIIARRECASIEAVPRVTVEKMTVEKEESLKSELMAFIQSVKTQSPPCVSGEEGRAALAVAFEVIGLMKATSTI